MIKKILALMLAGALCFSLAACDDEDYDDYEDDDEIIYEDEDEDEDEKDNDKPDIVIGGDGDPDQTWTICWYLCGSDLESEYGAATEDLYEMMDADLPDNVQVVVETGGAVQWMNDLVDESRIERYLYNSDGINLVDQQPQANMGDPDTLAEFLSFCAEEYPADKMAVVFWNHGGGSVSGAAFDENYDYDALTLSEFGEAFNAVFDASESNPPLEMVGFDTCLMGSVDTAAAFTGIAHYLVASEELEPGGGWLYSGWLQGLGDNPGMNGAELGRIICDTYVEGCEDYGVDDEITLSVVDLTKTGPLMKAYEALGAEALTYALEDSSFFGSFGRAAMRTENYGGNTRDQGYTNMVDLGHLAQNCSDILPQTSQDVLDGLEECVVYKVNGPYRENAMGLSCYFSYNGDLDDLHGYQTEGCSDAFKYFFDYGLEGRFTDEGMNFIESLGYEEQTVPVVPDLAEDGEEEYPLYLDEEGCVVLELDPDITNMLKGIYFQLAYVDVEKDIMLFLGQDNDMDADWENGIFKDNFRGVWGSIDGHLVYMEVSYECDEYTLFSVPILLNDEEYNLRVIYDYEDEQFYILGARKGLEDSGMADKNLVQLRPGDQITTIHYVSTFSGDDEPVATAVETFAVTENTSFAETDMGNGTFLLMFELVDAKNNTATSELVQFTVDGENMDVEILD